MRVDIKKGKTRDVERLVKHFKKLSDSFIKFGYFVEQGDHSSGDPYTQIMQIHEDGLGDNPSRPVLTIGSLELQEGSSDSFNKSLKTAISSPTGLSKNLKVVGEAGKEHIQDIFGDPVKLSPVTSNPTPLLDTEELKNNLMYKVE